MLTKDDIEAGVDLTGAEIEACKLHLGAMMKRHGKLAGCISYCQRHMGVGWSHALRIIEYLEACGIVRRDDVSGDFIPGPSWDGRTHQ